MGGEDEEKNKRKQLGLSCMLNTEVGAVLAVIRRQSDPTSPFPTREENYDTNILQSLKSLRALIFNPHQEWCWIDPSVYLCPFLDVIQSDDMPAGATSVALSSVLKILKFEMFNEKTPGAKDTINSVVSAITNCRLEKTDPISEDAVMMRILQVLIGIMKHSASPLLTDHAVCTIVNTCFQVVQQSTSRGDLLQRNARFTMNELIQVIFSRFTNIDNKLGDDSESDTEDVDHLDSGYGIGCITDIFHFLCSLLNVVEVVDTMEWPSPHGADENVQLFALVLINSAIELSGDSIGKHPKLLRMVQDDLMHHLIHYGTISSPLVLSMISSTVLNIYHFLRRYIRLQIEAFFTFVLLRVATTGATVQLQEVALEAIINFCRQPKFILEAYVNYDCNPISRNIFEEIGKLLCKLAFPGTGPFTSIQVQAFEGLAIIIHNIADNIDKEGDSSPFASYSIEITEFDPFWEEKRKGDANYELWVEYIRLRKAQKKKILIAANHFNRDEKKGLEYLKLCHLTSNPPQPKAFATFFRFTPGLDKNLIGDYLGDPDELHVGVLKEFANTFEFSGMILDTALRTYLATFRLPGESQKIERILEAFAERFYEQQTSDIFVSKDAVYILCYSLIMLNTDQHNPQVKRRMTEDEFIRNNRAINGGQDLPRDYLSELFQSIAANQITVFSQSSVALEMTPGKWIDLLNRSKVVQPLVLCDFDRRLGRDMFACVAGPIVAALCAFFEHAEEDELFHECIEGIVSVARITQYGLEDTLDELLASFTKFTTLLNPYASSEETIFGFSHDMKPRMATVAVFTIANSFGSSILGGWRNIIDCLLKLKRLKLLPQPLVEFDSSSSTTSLSNIPTHLRNELGIILPASLDSKLGNNHSSSISSRFSHFLSLDTVEDSLSLGMNEFEQNMKVIKQCRIGSIFSNSSNLPIDSLLHLGRSLIFAAAGKGQKFSTPIEEEEIVAFCWELISAISVVNLHRFQDLWPIFHEYLLAVAQFPLFSPIPFAEKAMAAIFKICVHLLSSHRVDKISEDSIFKSINLMWKLDKEILDNCCEYIIKSVSKIIVDYAANLQTNLGWKSTLHLLSVTGRHPETYDQGVETLIVLLSNTSNVSRINYSYCIDCAFGFIALKNSPLDKNLKLLDLLSDSVSLLIQWSKDYSDTGSNFSMASNTSSFSNEGNSKAVGMSFAMNSFLKLGEAFRKTSLARREEIRNHAVICLRKSFGLAEELDFTPTSCINSFNLVIFAMVDDLHEKMVEYSRRNNAEREMRSMEETLKLSMELLTNVYLQFLKQITASPGFRTFWLGLLRRMDTCMKADLGAYGETALQEVIPDLLRKIITKMKEDEILVQNPDDDLWEITYIQIQWIAPSLKEELFPDSEL